MDWKEITKRIMAARGITQEDLLAKKVFAIKTRGGIGHRLNGIRDTTFEEAIRLAIYLDVSLDVLSGRIPLKDGELTLAPPLDAETREQVRRIRNQIVHRQTSPEAMKLEERRLDKRTPRARKKVAEKVRRESS